MNAICLCAALVIYIRYTIGWWSTLNSLMRKRNKEKVVRVSAQLDSVANSNLHYLSCAGNLSGIPENELCISWQSGVGILDTVLELHSPRCTCSRLTSFLPPPFPSPQAVRASAASVQWTAVPARTSTNQFQPVLAARQLHASAVGKLITPASPSFLRFFILFPLSPFFLNRLLVPA